MESVIQELEKLLHDLIRLRDQASAKKEDFRGIDEKREAEMKGYALAYTQAAGRVFELIESIKKSTR
jgi:hypothetical protein